MKLGFIFVLFFTIVHHLHPGHSRSVQDEGVSSEPCFSRGCLLTAASYLDNMDTDVDPCDDFYEYSCGRFREYNLLTLENPTVSVSSLRSNQHFAEVKDLLDQVKKLDEPDTFWKVKDFFYACMNSTPPQQSHSTQELLHGFGDWPILEGHFWSPRHFDWKHLFSKVAKLGFSAGFFSYDIQENEYDQDDSIPGMMMIRPNGSQFARLVSRLASANESTEMPLASLVLHWVEVFEGKKDNNETQQQARDIAALALQINEAKEVEVSSTEDWITVSQLQNKISQVNWIKLLKTLFFRSVSDDDTVLVKDLEWLAKVADILDTSDKRTVANYMLFEVLFEMYTSGLFTPTVSTIFKYEISEATRLNSEASATPNYPREPETPILVYCIGQTNTFLPHALSSLHARKYFDLSYKKPIDKMQMAIREEVKKMIAHSSHVEEIPGKMTEELLDTWPTLVGFYDEYFEDKVLDDIYGRLFFRRDDHVANMIKARRFRLRRRLDANAPHTHLKDEAVSRLGEADLYPLADGHLLVVPVSALRGAFYHKDRPSYLNIGSLGFRIGSGIAATVSAFLGHGNESLSEANKVIHERRTCHSEQPLKQFVTQHPKLATYLSDKSDEVSDILVKDSMGLLLARRAYEKWQLKHKDEVEQSLPAFNSTSNELFWISFANTLCESYEEDALQKSTHSLAAILGKLRVNAAVRNSAEFSRAFRCASDAPMSPRNKCASLL